MMSLCVRFCLILALASIFALPCFADEKLDSMKAIYEKSKKGIQSEHESKLTAVEQSYLRDLDAQIEQAKKAGNLDAFDQLTATKNLFKENKMLPAPYQDKIKALTVERDRDVGALTKKYVSALTKLKADYMQKNNIEAARTIDEECKRLEFVVANIELNDPLTKLMKGLVLHYDFEKSEGSKVTDLSEQGNDGQVNGAKWKPFAGGRKGLLEFDGIADHINVSDVSLGTQWSCSNWSRFPLRTSPDGWRTLFFSVGGYHQVLVRGDGQLGTYVTTFFDSGYNVNQLSGWHHICAVALDNYTVFYIDGRKIGKSSAVCGRPLGSIGNFGAPNGPRQAWGSLIDDVMIWNRALSEAEVKQVYKMTGGK